MFTLIFAAALAAAAPAQAAAPVDAHQNHTQHGQMDHGVKHEGHDMADMACCKDKAKMDCCKDKAKMDCCKQGAKPAGADAPTGEHDHAH